MKPLRKREINLAGRGSDYQSVVLWRRDGNAPMFEQLWKNAALREDLIAAIPNVDADIDEVVAKIPAKYFDDEPIEKSIPLKKGAEMHIDKHDDPEPVDAHSYALDLLNQKAEHL